MKHEVALVFLPPQMRAIFLRLYAETHKGLYKKAFDRPLETHVTTHSTIGHVYLLYIIRLQYFVRFCV
jgi:hypothetical protein